jgi:5-methylcytosine-specific restriction endonuclease McrA
MNLREQVWLKYDKHCAYCGNEIDLKGMQKDHIWPKCGGGNDSIENLNPSCRRCNHYKRSHTLEGFRLQMKSLHERIEKQYITKVGIDYGVVQIKPFDGLFYFEKFNKPEKI